MHNAPSKARYLLNQAVKRGELVRGVCEVCGSDKAEGHHEDYDRPLCVRWMCRLHHAQFHRAYGIGRSGVYTSKSKTGLKSLSLSPRMFKRVKRHADLDRRSIGSMISILFLEGLKGRERRSK